MRALKTLYFSLIHCHLIYGIQIWSCTSPSIITTLFRKQKASIRVVTGSKYNSHTEPLFKSLNILPLPSLCEFFQIQFVQRFVQGLLPAIFNNLWVTNAAYRTGLTSMSLRNSDDFYFPFARISQTAIQPYFAFPRTWSTFHREDIKIIRDKIEFNEKLKTYFLEKLSATVKCDRLFCPSCSLPNINANENI